MKAKLAEPLFDVSYVHQAPIVTEGSPGTEGNMFGFEGGFALKISGTYHLFTTEMAGLPIWTKTRLAYWRSRDLLHWERVGTLLESSGDFTGSDTHACLWSPMPIWEETQNRWVLTYVCYRSKPNTKEAWYRNYDGRIALAASETLGKDGMGGPYKELDIIMKPGAESADWEGLMGVDSFFPYMTDDGWKAWYGSSIEVNGLAAAPALSGPWERISYEAPVSRHTENPVVTKLQDGTYVAFFDGCGHLQKFGYMVSEDGLNWSEPIVIDLDGHPGKWWGLSRTPLGLIEEGEGEYTLLFTAYNRNFYDIPGIWSAGTDDVFDGYYASIGFIRLKDIRI
ncbi:hypothetical protein SY83_13320 [Paenibacillus swuensis]|uniref:Glycosyl hydrolase family 43 n=1 Tax=Paenibacillus swuensis TaxID=1178515 RepID=A0A172TJD9_9BACL|nr:hypothetical protein [Paenibacillus swuensis]ANE47082.1 hypothetical protein SY83_13320 [Paenibacillus swuensis]